MTETKQIQVIDGWPKGAPQNATYYWFTADHDPLEAKRFFTQRFGREPEFLFRLGRYLRAGPVIVYVGTTSEAWHGP